MDTDTAEAVVNEMIHENVLPAKYQHLITGEINRILREMVRSSVSEDKNREEHKQGWSTLPRSSDVERLEPRWNSLSRLSSESARPEFEGHPSLSRKGSMAEFNEFEDFPVHGIPI